MTPHDSTTADALGCEAVQTQLSEFADSGSPLTPELREHTASCADCAAFAEQWLTGPPAGLARRAASLPNPALRDRILRATAPNVVQFPMPPASTPPWITWTARIAACLVLAGFSYWLLNPVAAPTGPRSASTQPMTLTEGLATMENNTKHEQEAIQTALLDGGSHVRRNVSWTLSALE